MIDITLTDEEWDKLIRDWNYWQDESYPMHAGYILREAIKRDYPEEVERAQET